MKSHGWCDGSSRWAKRRTAGPHEFTSGVFRDLGRLLGFQSDTNHLDSVEGIFLLANLLRIASLEHDCIYVSGFQDLGRGRRAPLHPFLSPSSSRST